MATKRVINLKRIVIFDVRSRRFCKVKKEVNLHRCCEFLCDFVGNNKFLEKFIAYNFRVQGKKESLSLSGYSFKA
jgi:hypothetical protein